MGFADSCKGKLSVAKSATVDLRPYVKHTEEVSDLLTSVQEDGKQHP